MLLLLVPITIVLFQSSTALLEERANVDSLKKVFMNELEQIPCPEFDARHRSLHQNGYGNMLYDVMKQDSLSALIAFVRMKLHKTFSLPQTALIKVIPNPSLEIRTPVVFNFPSGMLVLEWKQIKIYKHAPDVLPANPWTHEGSSR